MLYLSEYFPHLEAAEKADASQDNCKPFYSISQVSFPVRIFHFFKFIGGTRDRNWTAILVIVDRRSRPEVVFERLFVHPNLVVSHRLGK